MNKSQPNNVGLPKTTLELIKFMIQPQKKAIIIFFVLTFLGVLFWTASPFVISRLINELTETKKLTNTAWILVVVYGLFRVLDEVFWRISDWLMSLIKPRLIENIRLKLFTETLKKPHAFFVNSSSGRIGHWINQATSTTEELVDVTIWTVWGRLTEMAISTIFLFAAHWSLALLFGGWLILLFAYNMHRGKHFGKLVGERSNESSKASGMVVDSISNHLSVRVFNARQPEAEMLTAQQEVIIKKWKHSWNHVLWTNFVKGQSASVVSVIALVTVLFLYKNGQVEIGSIVLFMAYFQTASNLLWQLAWAMDSYYRHFATIQNALDGLSHDDERTGEMVEKSKTPKNVSLELKDISFAYPDQLDNKVIEDINIKIPVGQKLGIVGHSGAGKSTLAGLLLGFYEPTSGQILLNKKNIQNFDPSYIRSVCSYVPQDTNLFNRSVKENILYARPDATDQEIEDALEQAKAKSFVDKLPQKMDTIIGERGVKLSGGQRQRIAIARAFLKNSPFLLLDEATSALDSVSEQAIQKALHTLMGNRTAVVIAHRLSTLKHLDKIAVVDNGRIAEYGSHDELIKLDGIYADLWRRQKDGFLTE